MVGHRDDNNSGHLNVNVLTTPEWSAARKLNIQQFMPRELPPPDRNLELGRRLAMGREACGYGKRGDQGRFAKDAGIEPNTYNQWEKGTSYPRAEHIIPLCERHGLTMDWIYREKLPGLPQHLFDEISRLKFAGGAPGMKVVRPRRGRRAA
jgi:DNA-binding XRE family transcriptional regulator